MCVIVRHESGVLGQGHLEASILSRMQTVRLRAVEPFSSLFAAHFLLLLSQDEIMKCRMLKT